TVSQIFATLPGFCDKECCHADGVCLSCDIHRACHIRTERLLAKAQEKPGIHTGEESEDMSDQ
ncbi:hypothetical protein BGW80DRAFT_1276104, partial [Lactifluus volemus]